MNFKVIYEGKEYIVDGKNRNEVTSNFAKMMGKPIRFFYGKIRVLKNSEILRERKIYCVLDLNGKLEFSGSIEDVSNYLNTTVISSYVVVCEKKKINHKYIVAKEKLDEFKKEKNML